MNEQSERRPFASPRAPAVHLRHCMSVPRFLSTPVPGLVIAVFFLCGSARADFAVYLNELNVKGIENVELYNAGPDTATIGGWEIEETGTFTVPVGTQIAPGAYFVIADLGGILDDIGGQATLLDLLNAVQDGVSYGQVGSAPLPPLGTILATPGPVPVSLARAPDASAGAPPPPDPLLDGLVWTLDFSPTFGAINDAPQPRLGEPIVLNEIDPKPEDGNDTVELFNLTPIPIPINEWFLTNGEHRIFLAGVVPASGFLAVATDPGFDLEVDGLLYLFDSVGVRVDQLGFWNAPPLGGEECYARCPDGAGPNLGFDWATTGGGVTFFTLPCTPGATNSPGEECLPTPTVHVGWGQLKSLYR